MIYNRIAIDLIGLAYDDYIAARFLLNNCYPKQGITLASSAIEKYLKIILATQNKSKHIHLDRLDEIKKLIIESGYGELLNLLDDNFLRLLGLAYKFRYYDKIKTPDSVVFLVNQVIGELDYTVHLVEKLFLLKKGGHDIQTAYKRAVTRNDNDLFHNNYVLNGLGKKEHMEKETSFYGLFLNSEIVSPILLTSKPVRPYYDGKICINNVEIVFNKKQDVGE